MPRQASPQSATYHLVARLSTPSSYQKQKKNKHAKENTERGTEKKIEEREKEKRRRRKKKIKRKRGTSKRERAIRSALRYVGRGRQSLQMKAKNKKK